MKLNPFKSNVFAGRDHSEPKTARLPADPLSAILAERKSLIPGAKQLQRFMTGLPDRFEPVPSTGPVRHVARDIALLAASVIGAGTLGTIALQGLATLPFLIPTVYLGLAAAGRLRKLTVGHMHEATHGVGFDGWKAAGVSRGAVRKLRFWLAETCSVLALSRSAAVYMRKHHQHHRLQWLGTVREPDGAELAAEGFVRGMQKGKFWPHMLGKLLNPSWYVRANLKRAVATLTEGKPVRRFAAGAMWTGIIISPLVLPFSAWLFGIALPWLVFYPAASLLQVLTEHPYGDRKGATTFAEYVARTWDRIPWDSVPRKTEGWRLASAWFRWSWRFLLVHLPTRLAVLDTTMIWHRYHHIAWPLGRPFDDWWAIGHRARDAWLDGAFPQGWEHNTLRGLPDALDRQRAHLESPED